MTTTTLQTVTSADGTTIAFDKLGSGPAVVLVCGGSVDRQSNAGLAGFLASDFTVYNFDRRGRNAVESQILLEARNTDIPPIFGFTLGVEITMTIVRTRGNRWQKLLDCIEEAFCRGGIPLRQIREALHDIEIGPRMDDQRAIHSVASTGRVASSVAFRSRHQSSLN